tara:strand:- start:19985 stop:20884 length:900 start_codon:yes stop_codon:yes gene_type:complete
MAVHGENRTNPPALTGRDKHWLHAYLFANPNVFGLNTFNRVVSTDTILTDLGALWHSTYMFTQIRVWKETFFLPESDLDWISQRNQRQLIWLLNELRSAIQANPTSIPTPQMPYPHFAPAIPNPLQTRPKDRYNFAIAAIDVWALSSDKKRLAVAGMQHRWEQSQLSWRRTKWLDVKSRQQMDWAVDYINQSEFRHRDGVTFLCHYTDDPRDKHLYILGFLDHLYRLGKDSRDLFLAKMRKTWSQRKYRESEKAKKQVYFSLSDQARQHLSQLEKARKQSKNRIIEDLLAQAVQSKPPG